MLDLLPWMASAAPIFTTCSPALASVGAAFRFSVALEIPTVSDPDGVFIIEPATWGKCKTV